MEQAAVLVVDSQIGGGAVAGHAHHLVAELGQDAPQARKGRVLEHLLQALVQALALFGAHQQVEGADGRAGAQQFLHQDPAQEASGARDQHVLSAVELLHGRQLQLRLARVCDVIQLVRPPELAVLIWKFFRKFRKIAHETGDLMACSIFVIFSKFTVKSARHGGHYSAAGSPLNAPKVPPSVVNSLIAKSIAAPDARTIHNSCNNGHFPMLIHARCIQSDHCANDPCMTRSLTPQENNRNPRRGGFRGPNPPAF